MPEEKEPEESDFITSAESGSIESPQHYPEGLVEEPGGGRGFFRRAERVIDVASESFSVVAVIVLIFMMMMTVSDVVLRYFFNRPIMASAELTEYMMVIVGFLGIAWCATKGTHIKVELIVGKWSPKAQVIMNIINAVCVIAVCVLIASQSLNEGFVAKQMGRASEITDIAHYPFYWVVVFGYVLMFFVVLAILVHNVRKAVKP
ncbi:MAG: TRAP transporter small permease [Chloroflexota bacterium]